MRRAEEEIPQLDVHPGAEDAGKSALIAEGAREAERALRGRARKEAERRDRTTEATAIEDVARASFRVNASYLRDLRDAI